MGLKMYIVGRERRREDRPTDRERRAYNGRTAVEFVGIPDSTVSRRHAVIYVTEQRIYMRDLGSKNGTFVVDEGRARRFSQGYVTRDQDIRFGDHRCRLDRLIGPHRGEQGSGP
jgi:hypothetical protein